MAAREGKKKLTFNRFQHDTLTCRTDRWRAEEAHQIDQDASHGRADRWKLQNSRVITLNKALRMVEQTVTKYLSYHGWNLPSWLVLGEESAYQRGGRRTWTRHMSEDSVTGNERENVSVAQWRMVGFFSFIVRPVQSPGDNPHAPRCLQAICHASLARNSCPCTVSCGGLPLFIRGQGNGKCLYRLTYIRFMRWKPGMGNWAKRFRGFSGVSSIKI